jgi:hypothetical protein
VDELVAFWWVAALVLGIWAIEWHLASEIRFNSDYSVAFGRLLRQTAVPAHDIEAIRRVGLMWSLMGISYYVRYRGGVVLIPQELRDLRRFVRELNHLGVRVETPDELSVGK